MRNFLLSIALVALFSVGQGPALADELPFGADQFGKNNLEYKQSSAGKQLEAILGDRARFEPLATFSVNSILRKRSAPVGRLDIRHGNLGMTTCTASIISEIHVLTNHHCVPGTGEHGPVTAAELVMGYYDQADESTVRRFKIAVKPVEASASLDYAILRVEGNPSQEFGRVQILSKTPSPNDPLVIFHHPLGFPKLVTQAGCRMAPTASVTSDQLFHTCDTLPGSSGAPVFSELASDVIGLHYAGPGALGPGQYNFAKRSVNLIASSKILSKLGDENSRIDPAESEATSILTASGQPDSRHFPPEIPAPVIGARRDLAPYSTFRDCEDVCPDMVVVPAGEYRMGNLEGRNGRPNELPVVRISFRKPFAVSRFEITNRNYYQCVSEGYCSPATGGLANTFERPNEYPALFISWAEAGNYASWLSDRTGMRYRLLSEAEWEYVARAGSTTRYPWSDDYDRSKVSYDAGGSHFAKNIRWSLLSLPPVSNVGRFEANAWGLYDLIGNAAEWVQDCYQTNHKNAPADGTPVVMQECKRHVVRGGNPFPGVVGRIASGPDKFFRSAFRTFSGRTYTTVETTFMLDDPIFIGIRLAREIE